MLGSRRVARVVLGICLVVFASAGVLVVGAMAQTGPPAVSIDDVGVVEGAAQVELTLRLSHPSEEDLSVDISTIEGSAKANSDYQPFGGLLQPCRFVVFSAGETIEQPVVVIVDDAVNEGAESFIVRLSNPINATVADADGTVTIINDDGATVGQPQVSIGDAGRMNQTHYWWSRSLFRSRPPRWFASACRRRMGRRRMGSTTPLRGPASGSSSARASR